MVQSLIDETYEKFKGVVDEGRKTAFEQNGKTKFKGRALAENWRDYADGRILTGKEAHKLGFVDQLGDFDDAADRAAEIAGIEGGFNLIEYRLRHDLAEMFRLFGKSEARGLKIDLGLDLPKLQAGHLYFLSPTYLH